MPANPQQQQPTCAIRLRYGADRIMGSVWACSSGVDAAGFRGEQTDSEPAGANSIMISVWPAAAECGRRWLDAKMPHRCSRQGDQAVAAAARPAPRCASNTTSTAQVNVVSQFRLPHLDARRPLKLHLCVQALRQATKSGMP